MTTVTKDDWIKTAHDLIDLVGQVEQVPNLFAGIFLPHLASDQEFEEIKTKVMESVTEVGADENGRFLRVQVGPHTLHVFTYIEGKDQ